MNLKSKYKCALVQALPKALCATFFFSGLMSQEIGVTNSTESQELLLPTHVPSHFSVVDPFPRTLPPLLQPLDSINVYKGILKYNFGIKSVRIELSRDWSTITISETIGGKQLKIPFT